MNQMLVLCVVGLMLCSVGLAQSEDVTRVAAWKDGAKGAFAMMFDDSINTHVTNVFPELQERGLTGTFYVNPARPTWAQNKDAWEKTIPAGGMHYGNHTFTHTGFDDMAGYELELKQCAEAIDRCFPNGRPHLTSYASPGGVKPERWKIDREQQKELLKKYNLITRPPFTGHGAAVNVKTAEEMIALADDAIANGNMGYIIFHGVGGEWISADLDAFKGFLDMLAQKKDELWITSHIAAHKYETERSTAVARTWVAAGEIRVELTCAADAVLYDEPLTLITMVPAEWKQCTVSQGERLSRVTAGAGELKYDANPNGAAIIIRPAQ